jgi:hypothetical protein
LSIKLNGPTDIVLEAGQKYIERSASATNKHAAAAAATAGAPAEHSNTGTNNNEYDQQAHLQVQRLVVKVDDAVEANFERYDVNRDHELSQTELKKALGLGGRNGGVVWSNCVSSSGDGGGCDTPVAKFFGTWDFDGNGEYRSARNKCSAPTIILPNIQNAAPMLIQHVSPVLTVI